MLLTSKESHLRKCLILSLVSPILVNHLSLIRCNPNANGSAFVIDLSPHLSWRNSERLTKLITRWENNDTEIGF